jgi:DNA topoisomerase-2
MIPWYKGFTGTTEVLASDRFQFTGTIRQTGENELEVTELPVRYWTQDFKEKLEDIIKAEKTPAFIKDYIDYNTPDRVHFIIKMEDKHMLNAVQKGLEETFKLYSKQATSNLVAFDAHGRIHKYASVLDIMEEFYHVRLRYYEKRKQHQLEVMEKELSKMNNQARFIQMIIDGKLVVSKKKKAVLVAELKKLNFTPFSKVEDAKKAGEDEDAMEDDESETEVEINASDYDYLLGVSCFSHLYYVILTFLDGDLVFDPGACREASEANRRQGGRSRCSYQTFTQGHLERGSGCLRQRVEYAA